MEAFALFGLALAAAVLSVVYVSVSAYMADPMSSTRVFSGFRALVTCKKLQHHLGPSLISLPSDDEYVALREENRSQAGLRDPSCIASPRSATEVAEIVVVLVQDGVPFAVRSGNHESIPSEAGTDQGVLITLSNLNEVSYDAGTGLVTLGSGTRWDAVNAELDKNNVAVVGDRTPDVGVGNATSGCGLSYLSDLYALVCDNVVNYEVVLFDGRIVEANINSNPDLFWALKGGSDNAGIVTKFETKTYLSTPTP